MQKIKTKELPEGYFVTTIHYQSGNKEFESVERIIGLPGDGVDFPVEEFGTKHIQLIAVNPTFIEDAMDGFETDYYFSLNKFWLETVSEIEKLVIEITKKQYEKWTKLKAKGKDFFIYKVSETK